MVLGRKAGHGGAWRFGPRGLVQPIGHLARADAAGYLPRLGRAPSGPLGRRIIDLAQQVMRQGGGDIASVILRGSMARGGSRPADIDLIVVLNEGASPPQLTLPALPLPVEIGVLLRSRLLDPQSEARRRFFLAHTGVTLAGADILSNLPQPRLTDAAIGHLRSVRRWWPHHPQDWSGALAERRIINAWLAKRLIRSLAEGPMVRRGLYTRDIWPCLAIARQTFPTARDHLGEIAEQAVAPDGSLATLRSMTRTAKPLLEQAARRYLGQPLRLPDK